MLPAESRQTLKAKFDSSLKKFKRFLDKVFSWVNFNESRIKEINKMFDYLDRGILSAKTSIEIDIEILSSCGFKSLDKNFLDLFSSHVLSIKQVNLFILL